MPYAPSGSNRNIIIIIIIIIIHDTAAIYAREKPSILIGQEGVCI
jgi:hypothetical protein